MNTRFLSDEEVAQVRSIMAAYGLSEFGADVRLWGRGKAIEVSGTLDKLELSCLLAISRYLDDGRRVSASQEKETPALPSLGVTLDADRQRLDVGFAVA